MWILLMILMMSEVACIYNKDQISNMFLVLIIYILYVYIEQFTSCYESSFGDKHNTDAAVVAVAVDYHDSKYYYMIFAQVDDYNRHKLKNIRCKKIDIYITK